MPLVGAMQDMQAKPGQLPAQTAPGVSPMQGADNRICFSPDPAWWLSGSVEQVRAYAYI